MTAAEFLNSEEDLKPARLMEYGPIAGEYHRDAMIGPRENALASVDVAASPDYGFNQGDLVVTNDGSLRRVADLSYRRPGVPTHGTIELRDKHDQGHGFVRRVTSAADFLGLTQEPPNSTPAFDEPPGLGPGPISRAAGQDHSDAWTASQKDMERRAAEAGLPQIQGGRDRLIDALTRSEKSGFPVRHFAGTQNAPTGDRAPTMDIEQLVNSLKAREAAGDTSVSKELAYWQKELAGGMTAEQWRKQTGETDPGYPQEGLVEKALRLAKTPSPDWLQPIEQALQKPAQSVLGYAKGMIPADREGLMRAANIPTDLKDPEQLVEAVFPMIKPMIDVAQQGKGRFEQIQAAEKTPAWSKERYDAGVGTVLDIAGLAALMKGVGKPRIATKGAPEGTVNEPGASVARPEAKAVPESAPASVDETGAQTYARFQPPETTADVTRSILDRRKILMEEAGQLQKQAEISRQAGGRVHPAVEDRLSEINSELNHGPPLTKPAEPATVPPDEQTRQVAESPVSTTPGDIAPGQQPAADARPVGVGARPEVGAVGTGERQPTAIPPEGAGAESAPVDTSATASGQRPVNTSGDPDLVGVAARYREEQQPGSVESGTVNDAAYWRGHGRDYINQGGDPRAPILAAERGQVSPRNIGIVSAEYERLYNQTQAASQALESNPGNTRARAALDAATKEQASWSREMQPVLTRAGETLGALKGKMPVDETTFAGLYDKALELNNGREPTRGQQIDMFRRAQKASKAKSSERQSYQRLDKAVPGRAPTDVEMSARVEDITRRLTPCQ